MIEAVQRIAGLDTIVCEPADSRAGTVILLHGYAMRPADLSPFAHSLGVVAKFYFPRGAHSVPDRGYAWWGIDEEARASALKQGPRDLADAYPASRPAAGAAIDSFLQEVSRGGDGSFTVLGGFSQGGMLACDTVLRTSVAIDGLVMMSASRIAIGDWQEHRARLDGMPVLVSHGKLDSDLGFSAGERLRDWLIDAGALVTWVPFEGGHEIPLIVWRELRRFLRRLPSQSAIGVTENHDRQS